MAIFSEEAMTTHYDQPAAASSNTDELAIRGDRKLASSEGGHATGKSYWGQVLSMEDRTPLAGISTYLFECAIPQDQINLTPDAAVDRSSSSADGLFLLSAQESLDELCVLVSADGYWPAVFNASGRHSSPQLARVVLLSRSATLQVALDGPDVTGVQLWITAQSYSLAAAHGDSYESSSGMLQWNGQTDDRGECRFEGLPPNVLLTAELLLGPRRIVLSEVILRAGETRIVTWRPDQACRLTGLVIDQNGRVVKMQRVWLQSAQESIPWVYEGALTHHGLQEQLTDAGGGFQYDGVPPGRWWIQTQTARGDSDDPSEDAIAPIARLVEISGGQCQRDVHLQVERGTYIRGIVLDPSGAPAPDAYVFGEWQAHSPSTRTMVDGTFALGPLTRERYTIVANGTDYCDSDPIVAVGGEAGLVLRLGVAGGIKGRTLVSSTGEAHEARLIVAHQENPTQWFMTRSGEEGTFVINGLMPGLYDLTARGSEQLIGLLQGVLVREGEAADISVVMSKGASLWLKQEREEVVGKYKVLWGSVEVASGLLSAARPTEVIVPSGRIGVEYEQDGSAHLLLKELEIAVGEQRELVLGLK